MLPEIFEMFSRSFIFYFVVIDPLGTVAIFLSLLQSLKGNKYKTAIDKFEKYLNVSSSQNVLDSVKKELKLMCYNAKGHKINDNDYYVSELII